MGRGCADSLESQEFPIIIPLPLQQQRGSKEPKNRTAGPEAEAPGTGKPRAQCPRWHRVPRRENLRFRALGTAGGVLSPANEGLKLRDPGVVGHKHGGLRPTRPKNRRPSNPHPTLPRAGAPVQPGHRGLLAACHTIATLHFKARTQDTTTIPIENAANLTPVQHKF